jgi:hypothetical protein
MAEHGPKELQGVGRVIQARARASLMSDTKWRKLLSELNKPERELSYCIVKFIDVSGQKKMYFPIGLDTPRPWVDDFGGIGPFPLRSIEWMLIPRIAKYKRGNGHVPDGEIAQDVDSIEVTLDGLGKYPTQLVEQGLLIRGHVTD